MPRVRWLLVVAPLVAVAACAAPEEASEGADDALSTRRAVFANDVSILVRPFGPLGA